MKRLLLLSALAAHVSAAVATEIPAEPPPAVFQLPPLETYAEVTARPLFSPDRRPRESAPVEIGASPIALKGIVVNGSTRYAVVEEGTPPVAKRVTEGQAVDAGTIKHINRDHVVLSMRNGTDALIKLFDTKKSEARVAENAAAGAAPAQPAAVPPEFAAIPASHAPVMAGPGAR
jgi:type II secretory pathway component PulC